VVTIDDRPHEMTVCESGAEWQVMCAITVSIRQAWHVSRAVYFVSSPEWQVETKLFSIRDGQVYGAGPLT